MLGRTIWSAVALVAYLVANAIYSPVAAVLSSQIATRQFDDSDPAFVQTVLGLRLLSGVHALLWLALMVALVAIWWKPAVAFYKKKTAPVVLFIAMAGALFALQPQSAFAYAQTGDDVAEWLQIESDEAAFLIPNFGATLKNQEQYTPDYLNNGIGDNGKPIKVPGKFIQIPHGKLSGSGGTTGFSAWLGKDYTTNTSTLVVVKRTQYSRVWTVKGKGTNPALDESFDCQTADGLNVKQIGVTTISVIDDKNAALYLSNYGPEPLVDVNGKPLDRTKIENIFVSVRRARTLNTVVDDVGYANVHELVCHYIAIEKSPAEASKHMNAIMDSVKDDYKKRMAEVGVTVKMLGWAGTWTFDDDVQFAMNQAFNAEMIKDHLDVLERNANVNLKEGLAIGFRTHMPATLFWGGNDLVNSAAVGAAARAAGTAAPVAPPAK
jgi:hypothetical protein